MSTVQNIMTQDFLFKEDQQGTSKKTGKPFRILTLHDPVTLDNAEFFLDEESPISTNGFKLRDKVRASFTMQMRWGKLTTVITALEKL